MKPSDLRVALFSGNYNYVRDGANQALNLLVGHLLARGVHVRVYSPTVAEPAFAPTGDLVDVPAMPLIGGRGEYRVAGGITRRSEEHTSELQSLMRISYAVFCLTKKRSTSNNVNSGTVTSISQS